MDFKDDIEALKQQIQVDVQKVNKIEKNIKELSN